ncbi:MAG: monovalent cation/H+ antiporter complex subunit F [Oscillospiraceae bacterium]|nr:monovalent cation/H+ antiporter complex subunit F [Oscillospiraceae bacterium]
MIEFALLFTLLSLYVIRAVRGPSVWDRLMSYNLISTKIIVIIIAISSYRELAFLMDFAIIYALTGFIGTIFLALFLFRVQFTKRRKRLKDDLSNSD